MAKNHVKERLSDFCLGALAAEESRAVAEHLLTCHDCRKVYEEVKLGVTLASQLTPVRAPLDLWPEIAARLDSSTLKSQISFLSWRPVLAMAAVLVLVTIGTLWYMSRTGEHLVLVDNYPTPSASPSATPSAPPSAMPRVSRSPEATPSPGSTPSVPGTVPPRSPNRGIERAGPSLEVISITGAPVVAANVIDGKGQLGVGEWLETDGRSRAQITVADIGRVDVDPNSRISLVGTRSTEHRLNLVRGRVHALISAPPRLFIVETPTATAVDLGCEYTLEVDEAGGSLLRVTGGYVALERKDREAIVPAGAVCLTRPGRGPGTPYFEDASELFRKEVNAFDLAQDKPKALAVMLTEARRRDTLTLWNLLPQVSGVNRERVYERLVELFPPPDGVSRSGILNLDREMLDAYRKRLEWAW